MVGTAAQIERDIAALDKVVSELAGSLDGAYSSYLTHLGQAIRQQLMLACYHICTQGHPDRFLELSYNQRQQLQQTLKHLASQAQEELLACHLPPGTTPPAELDTPPEAPREVPPDAEPTVLFRSEPEGQLEPAFFLPPMQATPLVPPAEPSPPIAPPLSIPNPQPLTPMLLHQWQQELEQSIGEVLRTTSHAANRILQQAGILSKALPEALLELAATADGVEMSGHVPNVMNLLVGEGMSELLGDRSERSDRSERTERAERHRGPGDRGTGDRGRGEHLSIDLSALTDAPSQSMVQLLAIHLNLSEIEFGDPSLTLARTQVRQQLAQLRNLGRDYQKKLKERAIAAAQSAWRSSWTED